MTIIAVAGLTLLLVGLLTVLTLERKTARSYSDAARADLAVESGLAVALGSLTEITSTDGSLVFRLEDPTSPTVPSTDRPLGFREQFFTYGAVFENGVWRGIPLFSGADEAPMSAAVESGSPAQPSTSFLDSGSASILSRLTDYAADAENLISPTEFDQNIPKAKWVDVTVPGSTTSGEKIRYAYWIEDLSGRINGEIVGTRLDESRTSVADLDISTVLVPSEEDGNIPEIFAKGGSANKQAFLRTSASVRPLLGSLSDAKRIEPYVVFPPTTPAAVVPDLIPEGYGYPDAGQPKTDLNELVRAAATDPGETVDRIAAIIDRNLPLFKERRGEKFPLELDYLKNIAASIIDYADADSDPTTSGSYRGIDSYPFVTEMADRYQWVSKRKESPIKISVETYVELWNPTQQEITGDVELDKITDAKIEIPFSGDEEFPPITHVIGTVTIPPNGYRVFLAGEKTHAFEGAFPPAQDTLKITSETSKNPEYPQESKDTFRLKWNGNIVDLPRGGHEFTRTTLRGLVTKSGPPNWKAFSGPLIDFSRGHRGDPRASYYINNWNLGSSYEEKSNWGGRMKTDSTSEDYNEIRITDWPDKGSNSTPGTPSLDIDIRPTDLSYPPNQPEFAPNFISNAGRYETIGELGNVFDPAQILDVNDPDSPSFQLTHVQDRAPYTFKNKLDMIPGGGMTLAIGRKEFAPFDKDGKRAAQLLDLFTVREQAAAPTDPAELININTAPAEVLRSLVSGITMDLDPLFPELKLKETAQIGKQFADYIVLQRAEGPLRSVSDFNRIGPNPFTPSFSPSATDKGFFGETNELENATDADTTKSLGNAGREELFKRVSGLLKFRTENFRIIVKGEVLNAGGEVQSRATREYHYKVQPSRDSASGAILFSSPPEITKFYEKSY